jgi:hypothetical protein
MHNNQLEEAVLKTLIYFSIFSHPLTKEEIIKYLTYQVVNKDVDKTLTTLINQSLVTVENGLYGLCDHNLHEQAIHRSKYEHLFKQTFNKVHKSTKLIAKFPFVKGVFISGSMSKGVVKEDGDIDFFIITATNRLWICRSLLIAYKKIWKLNSHKYFCLNYFVGEESLKIPDENIFTATEIATMIPMYNTAVCEAFKQTNSWYKSFLPNYKKTLLIPPLNKTKSNIIASLIEQLLVSNIGNFIDRTLMRLTLRKWMHKFPEFTSEMMDLAMRSKRNVSKHHPNNFQQKVLEAIKQKEIIYFSKMNKMSTGTKQANSN